MSGIFLENLKNVINGTGKDGNKCFVSEQKDCEFFLESKIYGYKEKNCAISSFVLFGIHPVPQD